MQISDSSRVEILKIAAQLLAHRKPNPHDTGKDFAALVDVLHRSYLSLGQAEPAASLVVSPEVENE